MLGIADYFAKQGHLSTPCHYQLCLGVLGGMPATVENLVYLVRHLPENATWSAFGVGKSHLPILYAALALGGQLYLLDEPFTGVDPARVRRLMDALRALDAPVLLSSHETLACSLADQVICLDGPPLRLAKGQV